MAIPFSTPRNHEIWGDAQIVESPLKLSWRRSLSKSTTTRYSKEEVRINMASEKADRPDLQLDHENELGFIKFFKNLSEKDPSTIRVFERSTSNGIFYSVHGEDAIFVAQNVYRTLSIVKYLGHSDPKRALPSATLSSTVFSNFLRDALLTRGLRVEIWTTAEARNNKNWKLTKQASPGNLQDVEDLLGNMDLTTSPVVLAVKLQVKGDQKVVGIAFADASAREIGVSEFIDNDVYSNFESLIIQLGVKECVIPSNEKRKDHELAALYGVVDRCGIAISEKRPADFTTKDIEGDIKRLLGKDTEAPTLPQFDLQVAMGASAALIKYLGLMSDASNFGQYTLYQHNLSAYMRLDASALRALNLMPGPNDGANKTMSLFGLLNKCKTALGTRLLAQWLKQPLLDLNAIEKRQTLVEAFVMDTEVRQTLQEDHLRAIPDLSRLSKRFQRQVATLEDVVRAYQVVIRLPGFVETINSIQDDRHRDLIQETYVHPLQTHYANLAKLQEMVEATIDLAALEEHQFVIKPDFDDNLKNYRKRMDDLRDAMSVEHIRVGNDLKQDTEKKLKLEQQNVYGWCLRLTRNVSTLLTLINDRKRVLFEELATQKAGVYFTTTALHKMSAEYADLFQQYHRHQSGLVKEVVGIAASYTPVLQQLGSVLGHLDVIVSFAHVSVNAPTPYVKPTMHERGQGDTILTEARHPNLEVQDDITCIPNDVILKRGQSEFLIITGPNMGGKSTYIRMIGVIALMAQVGCFVPCTEATLSIFDCVLARVGAGDSQLKGLSTFMAEMLETATILRSATSDSLIIIDELGRGTSTYDGFGLAWAISEYIVKNIKCFALFATHFHELTALSVEAPQVKNLHVVAHVGGDQEGQSKEITLLYKVEEGVCDQSFGIHVAELARFPEKVVKMAKRKADELEDFSGKDVMEDISNAPQADVEEGSNLLKQILREWRDSVKERGVEDDKDEMIGTFKGLLEKNKQALEGNVWIQQVMAL